MKEVFKKIKKSRGFSLVCILLFIGVCFAIGASIAYVEHETDPTDEATIYFRAFTQKNYEKMYSCLYQEEGYFIDKDMYMNEMKKLREKYTIDSYEIKEPDTKDGRKFVVIQCKNETTKKSKDFVVYIEAKRTGLQVIPDYYVDVRDMMAKEVDVTIPKNDRLELNGTQIDENTAKITENDEACVYHLKGVLTGKYKVSATNDAYARNKILKISGKQVKVDLTKEKTMANDKYEKRITENGETIIERFYKATRNRDEKSKKLLSMFSTKKMKNRVSDLVKKSEDVIFWPEERNADKYKVLDMKIKNLKTSVSYNVKDKTYTLTCTYQYKYVSSTDTSLASSYVDQISGVCDSKMKLVYKADKDKLTVESIQLKNKNKKK